MLTFKTTPAVNAIRMSFVETEKKIDTASQTALLTAARAGITAGSQAIRQKYNITARRISKGIKIAQRSAKSVVINVDNRKLTLSAFSPRQTLKGVTVKIYKAGGRQLFPGAFIGGWIPYRKKGGKYGIKYIGERIKGLVAKRVGKEWKPIKVITTDFTIASMLQEPEQWQAFENAVSKTFEAEFGKRLER